MTATPTPGSPEARKRGCTCTQVRYAHYVSVSVDCPLHGYDYGTPEPDELCGCGTAGEHDHG